MTMSSPGPDDEVIVVHRGQRPGRPWVRRHPIPELGVHLHGPRMLASSEHAALALRAVYGYSWGLEIEVKAVRRKWEGPAGPNGPVGDYSVGLAVSKPELVLHSLAPGPDGNSLPWLVGGGGESQIGFEYVITSMLAFKPYPATGSLWLGWSWKELGLAEGSAEISLPEPGAFESLRM